MFQEDLNTSTSWDLIDPDCDAEVADITKEQTQPQVNQVVNASIDSTQAKPDRGLEQVSNVSLHQNLGTLYNQNFFIADTTGRRLSQMPHKLNYPYPLPNGHSALCKVLFSLTHVKFFGLNYAWILMFQVMSCTMHWGTL